MTNHLSPSDHQVIESHIKYKTVEIDHWLHEDLFSFNWWLLLVVMLLAWGIWWKLVDKQRLSEMVAYGAFVSVVAVTLDEIGTSFAIWEYTDNLLPIHTPLFIFDLVQVPVAFSLIYQFFPRWKSYLVAITLLAAFFAFCMEPLLVWLGIYVPLIWKPIYSFPVYILMGIFLKWIIGKVKAYEKKASVI